MKKPPLYIFKSKRQIAKLYIYFIVYAHMCGELNAEEISVLRGGIGVGRR